MICCSRPGSEIERAVFYAGPCFALELKASGGRPTEAELAIIAPRRQPAPLQPVAEDLDPTSP